MQLLQVDKLAKLTVKYADIFPRFVCHKTLIYRAF